MSVVAVFPFRTHAQFYTFTFGGHYIGPESVQGIFKPYK